MFNKEQLIKDLDSADLFIRDRIKAMPAPLNEYDILLLQDAAEACDSAARVLEKAVIPPVDVGDKVWYIEGGYYRKVNLKPREITVTEISKKKSGKTIEWAFIANSTRYKFTSIGKTVFLNKKDCEAAIEKRIKIS